MPSWRQTSAAFSCLLFLAGFLAFLSALLIRGNALTTDFYMHALDETHAFDRVYDDLLSDPEFSQSIEPLFGALGVDRSFAVSTLRFVAPPEQLRAWSEQGLDRLTAYARGDVDRYAGELDLVELIENQRTLLVTYVTQQIIDSNVEVVGSQEQLESELDQVVNELTVGRVPERIPSLTLRRDAVERVTESILRPLNPQAASVIREQVETYVSLNDIVGALVVAVPALIQDEIDAATAQFIEWLGGDTEVDPASKFADLLEDAGPQVINRLDEIRTRADRTSPRWMPWASIGVMAAAAFSLLGITRGNRNRVLAMAGLLIVSGLFIWFVSTVGGGAMFESLAGDPLAPALTDRPEGWGLPRSARILVGDINDSLFKDLSNKAGLAGLFLTLPGVVLLAAVWLFDYVPAIARGRYNWLLARETAPAAAVFALSAFVVPLLLLNAPGRPPVTACNGHRELCDRRYDEVTFAATHNSMATAADGWVWPANDETIRQQLKDGVRALLIDTHYWDDPEGSINRIEASKTFNPSAMQVLRETLPNFVGSPPGTFLCHATCWLGAIRLTDALVQVREFLVQNPSEVVTLIIQDGVSVEDTEEAFEDAGLLPFIYEPEQGKPWPTLGEMVKSNERLVVMAEFASPPPDWYVNAWDFVQDTPFNARTVSALSCEENRGDPENSLFLMNHWIDRTPPDRVDSSTINSFERIIERARKCEEQRGLKPNFIAVNFHRLGDLFKAVDELNGLLVRR